MIAALVGAGGAGWQGVIVALDIDWSFIGELEGKAITSGYVPNPDTSQSGITIATGFDLEQSTAAESQAMDIADDLKAKLAPCCGLKGRAAFNREWFAGVGQSAGDTTVIPFTWPSAGKVFAAPPHMPPEAYLADQARAGKSGYHLAFFLNVIDQLRLDYKKANPSGRVFLLAHSMGNYALQAGVQFWFDSRGSNDVMFDEVFLAAADEVDDTFERPAGGRLSNLPRLANRISIYDSRKDVAMYLGTTVNLDERLGFDGPDDKRDQTRFPPSKFRIVDCTEVGDFAYFEPP